MLCELPGFRPLDGESFSKHWSLESMPVVNNGFRPLDGESFSKLLSLIELNNALYFCFRPLDGESFSKHESPRKEI